MKSLFSEVGDGGGSPSIPTAAAISDPVGNPPRSKVKGRKKEKRLKKRYECRDKEEEQVWDLQVQWS